MKLRIINQAEVVRLLPMQECIEVMQDVLAALERGGAVLPLRTIFRLPERLGALGLMPAFQSTPEPLIGLKAITVFPGNHGTDFDSHQGAVLLYEGKHGSLCAIVDATAITAIRTAAVSAVATRLLAREDAGDLAILGSGTQASSHLEAMLAVRKIGRIRIWSRNAGHVRKFVDRHKARCGVKMEACSSARDAVTGADLICTTTASSTPVLEGSWLAKGTHINAVGSSVSSARELDAAAVSRSRLFVDRRESTLNESGDFLMAKKEGAVGDEHILAEIGRLLVQGEKGRISPDDVTLFKSLGLAVEDLAAARHVYTKAIQEDTGTEVEFGGSR